MYKLASIYDEIFNDKEIINILHSFHTNNWKEMEKKDKRNIVSKLDKRVTSIIGYKPHLMKFADTDADGKYYDNTNSILISTNLYFNQYDVLDTYFHELRHSIQKRTIEYKNIEKFDVTKKELYEWQINFKNYATGVNNYVPCCYPLYRYQPVEVDAYYHGAVCTLRAAKIIQNKLGKDVKFEEYVNKATYEIEDYFLEDANSVKKRKEKKEQIIKDFNKNEIEEIDAYKEMIELKQKYENQLDKLSLEELFSMFNGNFWDKLLIKTKIDVLIEFDIRKNKKRGRKLIDIKAVEEDDTIEIDGLIYSSNDVVGMLQDLMVSQTKLEIQQIIEDKIDWNQSLKEDLKVNMFIHDGEYVNLKTEEKNPFLYLIQPVELYKSEFMGLYFKKIYDAGISKYGKDDLDWQTMIDIYSVNKINESVEFYLDKTFDEVYIENVEEMKNKIKKLNVKNKIK